jgi:pSer/pThr/pTyr-binding forkhead associated (FHA) protein
MPRLIIKAKGEEPERVIELKSGVNRFGRSSQNDQMFPFSEISEYHCELLVDNDFVFVRDMESSNGTFIDGDQIRESALYAGQTLQIGLVEMVLDAPAIRLVLPELPKPEPVNKAPAQVPLADGYPSCQGHANRHAIWECPQCMRVYCDECIRKLRRVGGVHLKLCPACSNPCKLTAWSEMMRKKKKGFFGSLVTKLTSGIKRTTSLLKHPPIPPSSGDSGDS